MRQHLTITSLFYFTAFVLTAFLASPLKAAPPSLFMTETDLTRVRDRIANQNEPFYQNYRTLLGRAESALGSSAAPFKMSDIKQIEFGWCRSAGGADDTLKDLTTKLEKQSDRVRTLALAWLLTNDQRFADAALEQFKTWASEATLVNMYDFNINFNSASFDGSTNDGYCGVRPWNMALDTIWQGYGLLNFADAYVILKENGYPLSNNDDTLLRDFLLELTEAVNAAFHSWTRWADAHPGSSAFTRYRSDNHLSWCLAPLLAGAVALDDDELAQYVLNGGAWTDSKAGRYTNPSSIRSVIDYAIESGTGTTNEGRVYEEKILRDPPVGYAFFHLWPMALVATIAEKHYGDDVWNYKGADDGAGLQLAYERYAGFVLGERASPKPDQDGDMAKHAWHFEFPYAKWPTDRFADALSEEPRERYIVQGVGPLPLIIGRQIGEIIETVSPPIISAERIESLQPIEVSLSTSTTGAMIYFTTDGSTPTSSSSLYQDPFTLTTSTTVRAIAIDEAQESSSVRSSSFSIGEITTGTAWFNETITPQDSLFEVSFQTTPASSEVDTVIGLAPAAADQYSEIATILQFYTDGQVRVRNAGQYTSDTEVSYQGGTSYQVRMQIAPSQQTYSVWITPADGTEIQLAQDYAFRSEQSEATSLNHFTSRSLSGSQTVSHLQFQAITPVSSYQEFAESYALASAPEADEDNDGVPNLLEYLFRKNPQVRDADGNSSSGQQVDDDFEFRFTCRNPCNPDVVITIQASSSLGREPGAWATIATRVGNAPWTGDYTVSGTPIGEGLEQLSLKIPLNHSAQRFYRLTAALLD